MTGDIVAISVRMGSAKTAGDAVARPGDISPTYCPPMQKTLFCLQAAGEAAYFVQVSGVLFELMPWPDPAARKRERERDRDGVERERAREGEGHFDIG